MKTEPRLIPTSTDYKDKFIETHFPLQWEAGVYMDLDFMLLDSVLIGWVATERHEIGCNYVATPHVKFNSKGPKALMAAVWLFRNIYAPRYKNLGYSRIATDCGPEHTGMIKFMHKCGITTKLVVIADFPL